MKYIKSRKTRAVTLVFHFCDLTRMIPMFVNKNFGFTSCFVNNIWTQLAFLTPFGHVSAGSIPTKVNQFTFSDITNKEKTHLRCVFSLFVISRGIEPRFPG